MPKPKRTSAKRPKAKSFLIRKSLRPALASMLVVAAAVSVFAITVQRNSQAAADCSAGSTLSIVAHEDDSLIFQTPDLSADITAGHCVRTVFVTAGDDGQNATYWKGRETGVMAGYAQMAGVANAWTAGTIAVSGHTLVTDTLTANPRIALVFMRLPDGNPQGTGFSSTKLESLQKLWTSSITTIHTVDNSGSYTKPALIAAMTGLMNAYLPTTIRLQDYVGQYGDGDHSDHHTTAYMAQIADEHYTAVAHNVIGYWDYPESAKPANLPDAVVAAKYSAFLAYAPHDAKVCQTRAACETTSYGPWFLRQYTVAANVATAAGAIATASSQNTATSQQAAKAIDGFTDGYPATSSHEWATIGGKTGSWLNLVWPAAQTVSEVVLYDRPNANDQITKGTITFSDGSSVAVGTLPNDGTPLAVTFAPKTITSLRLTITGVKSTTSNIGLAEMRVYAAN